MRFTAKNTLVCGTERSCVSALYVRCRGGGGGVVKGSGQRCLGAVPPSPVLATSKIQKGLKMGHFRTNIGSKRGQQWGFAHAGSEPFGVSCFEPW